MIVQVGVTGGRPFLTLPVPPHVGHFSQSHGTLGGVWTYPVVAGLFMPAPPQIPRRRVGPYQERRYV